MWALWARLHVVSVNFTSIYMASDLIYCYVLLVHITTLCDYNYFELICLVSVLHCRCVQDAC